MMAEEGHGIRESDIVTIALSEAQNSPFMQKVTLVMSPFLAC